jgi:hypothetical protein
MSAFSFMINIINIIFYVVNFNNKKVLLTAKLKMPDFNQT